MLKRVAVHPLLRLVVVAGVLLWPSAGLGRAWCRLFSAVANALAPDGDGPSGLNLHFTPAAPEGGGAWSVVVDARRGATGDVVRAAQDVRRAPYVPMAFFLALSIAFFPLAPPASTPSPARSRRVRRFAIPLAIVGGGLGGLALLALLPLATFLGAPPLRLFDLGATAYTAATVAYRALVAPPGMAYAVPLLLWLATRSWLRRT